MENKGTSQLTILRYSIPVLLTLLLFVGMILPSCKEENSNPTSPTIGGGSGATYYVAQNGNNANPGTEERPWQTIQKAASTMVSGDTLLIKEGIYQERVIPQNSGSGQYITYAAYPGHSVTIDGSRLSLPSDYNGWGGLFDLSNKSYIYVSGLRIMNAGPHVNNVGILVDHSSHIILENNVTYNTVSSGIGVWNSQDIIVRNNEVELCCNDGLQECITVANTDSFEVSQNHVHHGGSGTQGGEGIDIKMGSKNGKVYQNHVHDLQRLGIYVDAWDRHTYDIEIYQNIVHNCEHGIAVASEAGGLLENVRIYNNIVYDNNKIGIAVGWLILPGSTQNIFILNNTLYQNGRENWSGGIKVMNSMSRDIVIRNNICSQNRDFQIAIEAFESNVTVDHNLIDGFRNSAGEVYSSAYVEGNPLFVSPSGADFHLQSGSPAIDSGTSDQAPYDDFDGVSIPQGAGYDIGAFEKR